MVKINALVILFIFQFLLIFLVLTIVFYRQYKKQKVKAVIAQGELRRLRDEARNGEQSQSNAEVLKWNKMFDDLQAKFEQLRQVNSKLMESIEALALDAEKSDEYKRLVAEIEHSNKELDTCVGTLNKDNESLVEKMALVQDEVKGLSQKLNDTVHKSEYEAVTASKHSLELKVNSLKKELEEKETEYRNLEKNYMWLEKEYNALYENVSAASS